MDDATVSAGKTLTVTASGSAGALNWDGRLEEDGNFNIIGGSGNDTGDAAKAIGRCYNQASGEHFYTASAQEVVIITGQSDFACEGLLG